MRCAGSGGTASVVTRLDSSRGESGHAFPFFLPDGRHFLYLRVSRNAPENSGVYLRALETGSEDSADRRTLATPFGAAYVPDVASRVGRILFVRDAALYAQPFDERRLELSGNAVRVAEPIGSFLDGAFFAASTNGIIVFKGPDEECDNLSVSGRKPLIPKRRDVRVVEGARLESDPGGAYRVVTGHFFAQSHKRSPLARCSSK
jgi:hypothetical protein